VGSKIYQYTFRVTFTAVDDIAARRWLLNQAWFRVLRRALTGDSREALREIREGEEPRTVVLPPTDDKPVDA
jgi:hypothetical protein